MSGNFRIAVTCTEGLAPYVDVRGNFKRMKPKFAMTPSSISASLTRGKQYTFMVGISCYCFKHLLTKLHPDISRLTSYALYVQPLSHELLRCIQCFITTVMRNVRITTYTIVYVS